MGFIKRTIRKITNFNITLKKRNLKYRYVTCFFVEEIRKNLIDKYGEKKFINKVFI